MKIIFPPRPESKINPNQLDKWEDKGKFVVQRKFNGHRNLTYRSPEGVVSIYGRYGKQHGTYKAPPFLLDELSSLNFGPKMAYWLDGELLHPRIPDTIVLYDVLHAENYLFGRKLVDRISLLRQICRNPTTQASPPLALKVTDHVWMAETWSDHFSLRFKESWIGESGVDLIEGLVVKDPQSGLDSFGHRPYNVGWQWRCRKPGKSYQN